MTKSRVRVVLVDDHEMVLDALTAALSAHERIEVVGAAASVDAATAILATTTTDVVVTDLELDGELGTELVAHAARPDPPVPVLLITGTDDRRGVQRALDSGCAGFVSKARGFESLTDAVVAAAGGAAVFPAELLAAAITTEGTGPFDELSARELEVLQCLANARNVKQIASALHLSPHTVRNHVKQILSKLGAQSQLEAVVLGARRGLVKID